MTYTSFQRGSIVKRLTAKGYTWTLRYKRQGKYKAVKLGDQDELPTHKDAQRKAATLSAVINDAYQAKTFSQLIAKYEHEEMELLRPQTASSYRSAIKYLLYKFQDMRLELMLKDLMSIQNYISNLVGEDGKPLSKSTKQHIKSMLHRLIECAMRWGYLEVQRNPISLVEIKFKGIQPAKRLKVPITEKQLWALLNYKGLPEFIKVMIKLCMFLGLRISEVLGLRWEDIDLERGVVNIVRSCVGKHIDETKSTTSQTSLPLHPYIVQTLRTWLSCSEPVNGWLFGNAATGRPFHRDSLNSDYLVPAGKALGIVNLGWHTFRHSHRAFLRALNVAPETQQLLMRHANLSTTMEYGVDDHLLDVKRPANEALAEKLLAVECK